MPAFHKLLIANRGEIACRIQRTAQALGYRTVAVFSEADADALHVRLADEAVLIGPASVQQSYLAPAAILEAARRTGADAIHPGYGFLAEHAGFARACAAAGIVFIGPSPEAIELMGSKRRSKIAMLAAGVPCIAGYEGDAQDDDSLHREAARIGYPLMIKASAGGGGRGMRLVRRAEDLAEQLRTARSEALHGFGDDELILEQALPDPRHVEVQIFGDHHGHLIHLGERDCSIQRRHQKIIEEAPCPVMTAERRQAMGEAALKAGRAVDYVGAGTVEFLLAADGRFYFLEMNTRLQVEHPVTELVTGQDLVAWQLDVAAGRPLPLRQDQVHLDGHAMEVRLYAEDPAADFLPQAGRLIGWEPPAREGVRIDHGLREGQAITPFYDPMLGKLIAHGATREQARRRLLRAVEDCVLLGVQSNQRLLAGLLAHPRFIDGDFGTGFIEQHLSEHAALQAQVPTTEQLAIATALFYQRDRARHATDLGGWRNNASTPLRYRIGQDERDWTLDLLAEPDGTLKVHHAGRSIELKWLDVDPSGAALMLDGVRQQHRWRLKGSDLWLFTRPGGLHLQDRTRAAVAPAASTGDGLLQAPMDGAIVEVLVSEGTVVRQGQLLMVLEAMKMEHPLKAGLDGVVRQVQVKRGEQVRHQQVLLRVEAGH
ncbi:acetyl/propionyl/methylcrotonyl-CoA carboxylase subunit alpha [Pseudomonas citrulli]|uniref:Acetyl/propionyl/methylcrotonyl-CoA carboxylase subunit alpha n=1 Tax=Pseudomonas citrulli TaxID=3064347 RepID=A0ABT9BSK2_9PSED|nr:acetyl/propionyl/methylcrotonyl-CoA carboxylase subunit alpha [Pseudomonas sp. K18]MDO7895536.1 acetyl/propionyl/methylcrotonyl-CoA carboxylase subunit alpha [Pseudomonas sp. K18]